MTFAVDTRKLIKAWEEYGAAAYHFGLEGIKGWSMVGGDLTSGSTVKFDDVPGIKYDCSDCDLTFPDCSKSVAARKKKSNRMRTPPGTGHSSSFIQHLKDMLGWKTFEHGSHIKEDDWWSTMTPVRALENLRERQEAMIRSPKCMYLDDSSSSGGGNQPRFRAIVKGSPLHKIWSQSVTAMFESGDWKNIDYRDVIPGEEVDMAIRQVLGGGRYRTTPEKYFNLDKRMGQGKKSLGIQAPQGPSVLGDPTPPAPPDPIQVGTARVKGMTLSPPRAEGVQIKRASTRSSGSSSKKKKSSSAAPLLIGAAAVGLLMMHGRK